MKNIKGLSGKEMEMVSYLELKEKFFFKRDDVRKFFKTDNEMNVYIHRLKSKGRIRKLNKSKYYLIPVRAYEGYWSENPFIIIDEIFNGKNYYIAELAAAFFWSLIEQIPTNVVVYCKNKQGKMDIFNFTLIFKRKRTLGDFVEKRIKGHKVLVQSKESVKKWLKEYRRMN